MTVESVEGKGTTFTLIFPISQNIVKKEEKEIYLKAF
jgi:chemotaxis protein histidine kinase CheA